MKKIKVLSKEIVDKIAAGEVIDRPVAVVKELLENSIDAKSSNIKIEITDAGMRRISILDDGFGMDEKNLKLAYLPHTTSKIECDEDLLNICSYGFRGEALSSMSVVGDLIIKSRIEKNDFGKQIKIVDAKIVDENMVGMPVGTEIIVENLFQNIPARKKFLKNLQTEFRAIVDVVTKTSLAFPNIGFVLSHNNKNILKFSANQKIEERLELIFGKEIFSNLINFDYQDEYLSVQGFVGKPQIANRSNSKQFIFVNNRVVKNSIFCNLIKDTFGGLLEARANPVFILFFKISPENIDVNIHPRKKEIKFFQQKEINKSLKNAISEVLKKENLSYYIDDYSEKSYFSNNGLEEYTASILRDGNRFWDLRTDQNKKNYIAQIHQMYLLAETKNGLLLIDQHAAHERIIYEELLEKFQKIISKKELYFLKKPYIVSLPFNEFILMQDNLELFKNLGFDIENFGNNSFRINAVLDIFKKRNFQVLIEEFLVNLKNGLDEFKLDSKTEKTMAYLACRSAIKAGDYLSQEERKNILEKLQKTKSNYTCPHGRPTHIEISLKELHSMFKRI